MIVDFHCHAGLGKAYRRTGKSEQEREHFATATTMYHEMSMTSWLEKLERELKALSGDAEHRGEVPWAAM